MNICDVNKCTSCGACVNTCPSKCISFKTNEYGFAYPNIDNENCIDCGKCKSVCHAVNNVQKYSSLKAYAVWSNDAEDRKTSTSGGAASVFYKKALENGGYCYGAAYDNELNVVIKGYKDDRITEFKQSKYVHSYMNNCFFEIKQHLENGLNVIIIALPCQIASIKAFFKKDYPNLLLVDLICHGTPPQEYLNQHIKNINNQTGSKADKISFREDNDFFFSTFEKGIIKFKSHKSVDTYLLSFFESLTYYDSCYSCKYACNERCSDITIGDFWGLGQDIPFNHPYSGAISLVLTNTEKGQCFFNSVKNDLFCEERTVCEAVKGNAQLNQPSNRSCNRDEFLNDYKKSGFEYAVKKIYLKRIKKNKRILLKNRAKSKIRSTAKGILRR